MKNVNKMSKQIKWFYIENRLPFFASLGFGLLAYGFCMMNKIPVGDDLVGLFEKGSTTPSGRYGLELLRLVMPDASMPWIYGLMSVALLAAAVCVILRIFPIRSRALQVLFAGAFVCFPAQAGTMLYMFTAAPYAVALLLTVTGLWVFTAEKKGRWITRPCSSAFRAASTRAIFPSRQASASSACSSCSAGRRKAPGRSSARASGCSACCSRRWRSTASCCLRR